MKKYYSMFFVVCIINFSCGGGEVKTDGHTDGVYEEDFFEEITDMESEVPITCGNGIVDDGEECDDGKNGNPDDGCTDECRYSCHVDSDCSDGEICNGEEVCNLEYHVCSEGTPHEDGFICLNEPRSICLNGECRESLCGDGFIDSGAGEFCDPPGNNGCKEDCTFECNNDFECYNDEVCDGEEFCDLTTHTCAHRNVPPEGAECGTSPRKICLGGRCQESVCGDTFVDTGSFEECDDGNAVEGDGCDNDCTFSCHSNSECDDGHICTDDICNEVTHTCRNPLVPRSFLNCRPAAGECDIPEYCDGIHPDCPSDMLSPSTTLCRPSAGICDVAEYCTGSSPFCPVDGFLSSDTVCRSSAGPCDVAEHCTGTSVECPVDSFLSSDTICRPSAGDCDIAEYCTGTSAACPRDAFLPSTTVCRPSTGPCDAEEYCTGSSAACPPDAPPPVETCNGLDDDCDGVCDDGFGCCRGTTESCTTTCGTTGTKTCSNWCTWGSCVPPAETCNGIDDDCDGTCDEGFACCAGRTSSCTIGSCTGTQTCLSSCTWGSCQLSVPSNDTCSGAINVGTGGTFTGTTCGANNDYEQTCGGSGSPDVVYRLDLTIRSVINVHTCSGTSFDTVLYLRSGDCSGSEVACNDESCGHSSWISTTLDPGTYYIIVDGYNSSAVGSFTLRVATSPSCDAIVCPSGQRCLGGVCRTPPPCSISSFGGHEYAFCSSSRSWSDARSYCVSYGGYLTTINTSAENSFLISTMPANVMWMGYNDISSEGVWVWVNGEPTTFRGWCAGEPNNDGWGNEDCGQLVYSAWGLWQCWNDGDCGDSWPFVCEWGPY